MTHAGKRGPKPKRKVPIKWSADLAYAMGLLVTDGSLSKDGRHIDLTSIDYEQLENFKKCLDLNVPITLKNSGYAEKQVMRIQFSDVVLYDFLLSVGFSPAKTKTIGELHIPHSYFFDFLRGHYDGDGCFYSYWDKRWKSSFMYYLVFASASDNHIKWLQKEIFNRLNISGHITRSRNSTVVQLKYAKSDSLKLLRKMYSNKKETSLARKRLKIEKALSIVGENL